MLKQLALKLVNEIKIKQEKFNFRWVSVKGLPSLRNLSEITREYNYLSIIVL